GGLGVAFFAPFSNIRYFLRWRPIVVSPISVYGFVGRRGLIVLWSELGWVWLPAALIFLAGLALRRSTPREAVETNGGRSSYAYFAKTSFMRDVTRATALYPSLLH